MLFCIPSATQFCVAKQYKRYFFLLSLLGLSGCATFSQDGGFNAVQKTTQQYIQQTPVWANSEAQKKANATQVEALLKAPLSIQDAVQIALLNNSQLQADFYQLQMAEADLVQAGRLPNPSFSMLYARNNGDYTIEQVLSMQILALFTLPKMSEIEKQRFAAMQNQTVLQILELARQTRNAYIHALAANARVQYVSQANDSAKATYTLAKRMRESGNWSALDMRREQAFYVETALDLDQAKNQRLQAEEALTRLLGLSHPDQFKLPEQLNPLPDSSENLKIMQADDVAKRLDLQQMRLHNAALAKQLGLVKAQRFINVLEIGPARILEGRRGDPSKHGVEFRVELPIFDWGTAKVKRAEAIYMQSLYDTSNKAIVAASEIRSQHSQYTTSYAIAKRYRDEIMPLKKQVLEESVLRYNGMLISPFEVMVAARDQVQTVNRYIEALRDFWLAESDFEMSLVGAVTNKKGNE